MKLEIKVDIKEGLYFPSLANFGSTIDDIVGLHCSFFSGKAYGIIGECGSGGWGLSSVLTGRDTQPTQKILINEKEYFQEDLKQFGWYVGDGIEKKYLFGKEKSVLEQIKFGVKSHNSEISVDEIVQKFHLSKDRLDMKLSNLSWEKWRASTAIGYALQRKIFCFPWLNTAQVNDLILNTGLHIYIDILKKEGATIIVPTEKKEALEGIVDEYVILNNPRHEIAQRAREQIAYHFQEKNG